MAVKKLFFATAVVLMMPAFDTADARDQGGVPRHWNGSIECPKAETCHDPRLFSTVDGCNDKNTSTGAKLFGGYQFNQHGARCGRDRCRQADSFYRHGGFILHLRR
jgi:hypothetical protein